MTDLEYLDEFPLVIHAGPAVYSVQRCDDPECADHPTITCVDGSVDDELTLPYKSVEDAVAALVGTGALIVRRKLADGWDLSRAALAWYDSMRLVVPAAPAAPAAPAPSEVVH